MTIRNLFLSILIISIAAGCNKVSYRKTPGGMPYKVFPGKDTQRVMAGNIIKINLIQKINDSVYYNTYEKLPIYFPIPAMTQPYDLSEVWTKLKKGDSLIATQMMDTFIARNPANVPPNFKKGDRIVTYVKVLEVFTSDSIAQVDNQRVQKEWLQNEVQYMEKYLSEKKIPVQKTPSGAFVEIINPGAGNLIDSGNYLTLNYTGTSWSGKVFDSNTDTTFQHAQPYSFVTGVGQMIKGFDEAMRFLRKGAVARLYIPSTLGYGGNPNSPGIKPYEHLLFDIEILNVQEKMPDQPANLLNQQKVDAAQPKNK